jgi:IS30 family transposase
MRKLILRHLPRRHFTEEMRMILEREWNDNIKRGRGTRLSMRAFAKGVGIPYPTLRRELARGMEGGIFFNNIRREWFYPGYSAAKAQDDADHNNAQKGAGMKFTNTLAEAFRRQIVTLGKSPAHARRDLLAEGRKNLPCVRSVYNHIEHGDIGVQRGQTPYHPRGKRKRRDPVRKALKGLANRSIEQRPAHVADRIERGHWEMDAVVSRVGGRGGLLVMTERQTRFSIMVKLNAISAKAVRKALRKIIRDGLPVTIKTITTDNGSEFLDANAIERLLGKINPGARLYHTHAYAAWEKGSVENTNRHIRRFFPKGTDFSRVSNADITRVQNFINSIPRTSLKGLSAHEALLLAA